MPPKEDGVLVRRRLAGARSGSRLPFHITRDHELNEPVLELARGLPLDRSDRRHRDLFVVLAAASRGVVDFEVILGVSRRV
jgi:hypothetical protein